MNRSEFLAILSSLSVFAAKPYFVDSTANSRIDVHDPFGIESFSGDWTFIYRPDDLAWLAVQFENLKVVDSVIPFAMKSHPRRLIKVDRNLPGFVVVALPPQHMAEESYPVGDENDPGKTPVPSTADTRPHSRYSGGSRIVFRVDKGVADKPSDGLPYDFGALLACCAHLPIETPALQDPDMSCSISAPGRFKTAIEFPFRLFLAPHDDTTIVFPGAPKRVGDWTIMWKGEVTAKKNGGHPRLFAPFTAFDSGDLSNAALTCNVDSGAGDPEAYSGKGMRPQDRHSIVYYTGVALTNGKPKTAGIDVKRLALTSAGAIADLHWSRPLFAGQTGLVSWTHRAVLGRDDFVELTYAGTIHPYGHRAKYVLQVYRTVVNGIAILRSRTFLRFVEPQLTFSDNERVQFGALSITILDTESPNLVVPTELAPAVPKNDPYLAFVPTLPGGVDLRVRIERADLRNNAVRSRETVVFVSDEAASTNLAAFREIIGAAIYKAYQAPIVPSRDEFPVKETFASPALGDISIDAAGILWRFSAADAAPPAWTSDIPIRRSFVLLRNAPFVYSLDERDLAYATLPTQFLEIQSVIDFANTVEDANGEVRELRHYPYMPLVRVNVDPAKQIIGREVESEITRLVEDVSIDPATLPALPDLKKLSFLSIAPLNSARIFARLTSSLTLDLNPVGAANIENRAKSALVLVAPQIVALSGYRGLIPGDLTQAKSAVANLLSSATPNLSSLLSQLPDDMKIFGVVLLKDLIKAAAALTLDTTQIPKVEMSRLDDLSAEVTYTFATKIKPGGPHGIIDTANNWGSNDTNDPALNLVAKAKGANGTVTHSLSCTLTNVAIKIFDMIVVPFRTISFVQTGSGSPDVTVDALPPVFGSPLQLLNSDVLRGLLATFGAARSVITEGVLKQQVAFDLPDLSLGAINVLGLALVFDVGLPILPGHPLTFTFGLGSPNRPFIVAFTIFGGGGYISMTTSTDNHNQLSAAIEFGGYFDLDIVVASGAAYLAVGIAFVASGTGTFSLSAYVRAGGYLSILGIVSASIEFYAQMTAAKDGYDASADIVFEISLLFFSASVPLHFEKHFAGGGSKPQLSANAVTRASSHIAFDDWRAHRNAFA